MRRRREGTLEEYVYKSDAGDKFEDAAAKAAEVGICGLIDLLDKAGRLADELLKYPGTLRAKVAQALELDVKRVRDALASGASLWLPKAKPLTQAERAERLLKCASVLGFEITSDMRAYKPPRQGKPVVVKQKNSKQQLREMLYAAACIGLAYSTLSAEQRQDDAAGARTLTRSLYFKHEKAARNGKKVNRKKLAALCGMSPQGLGQWEKRNFVEK
jgi:DNA-binding transcriptional regulator YiaG